ncbi:MAG TPA: EAL domain-containing response regulator [Anaeromyxobacteraceae bacterium]|jgi:EAL domain-containing protein (putative c-di-GMP-specific phosphodiesterase class I)/CheY-like chemotaxis protein|nr:EAL domain-containing response regulator [Anaeromyxobacteraceae bacterium]
MGGRVLLVDDDPLVLRAYRRVLEQAGHEVESSGDGAGALALAARQHFDAVVSDVSMPSMDGLELLRRLRSIHPDLPVLLVTAVPRLESAVRALDHGALRYLEKPVENDVLVESVAKAVAVHRQARLEREALGTLAGVPVWRLDRDALERAFEAALGSAWIAFQPIVRWSDRRLFAYEALVRSADGPFELPPEILSAAERLGRLHDLGRLVRRLVAVAAPQCPDDALLFVNLHATDLRDPSLYDPAAPLSGLARRVVLEVTERQSLDGVDDVPGRMAALRRLGYRIAIDDLGAGYAGLASFGALEPEVIKLDMALTRGADSAEKQRLLIRAIATLGRNLHALVVAEGVETQGERDALVAQGCDLLQGFLFARPESGFTAPRF